MIAKVPILFPVRNVTLVFHSLGVSELLILRYDKGLPVLNFLGVRYFCYSTFSENIHLKRNMYCV